MKQFLHVGCGPRRKDGTTPGFAGPEWAEVRLDIDPAVAPDIVASMTDMRGVVPDAAFDALFSSHNLEHLYAHEVPLALAEFRRVLRPEGFAVITCPDLQAVARAIAEDRLTEPLGQSPAGPITPLDMVFGWRPALAAGNHFMAHRCGFTFTFLGRLLRAAGFASVLGAKPQGPFNLWVLATPGPCDDATLRRLARAFFWRPPPRPAGAEAPAADGTPPT
jgi:SAM-dependent methyltransferase